MGWWIAAIVGAALAAYGAGWCVGFYAGVVHVGRRGVGVLRAEGWGDRRIADALFPGRRKRGG